jgi:uncharacterized repeat protein (TIGR01451 family)
LFILLIVIVLLLSGSAIPAVAQWGQPPQPPSPDVLPADGLHGSARQDKNGFWYIPAGEQAMRTDAGVVPLASGGPDDYGYTWSDAVPLSWVNASGGTNRSNGATGLGFNFKFYENSYSQIFISQYGFATFDSDIFDSQSEIPNPASPNNVIAPYWAPLSDINGYIRTLTGGSAPNRYFVVEWNRVGKNTWGEEYTFEMILHESGDIIFQYQNMATPGSYMCQTSGIEDSLGVDGFAITDFCNRIASNHAVRIYRPAPAARVTIYRPNNGNFTHAGGTTDFQVRIRNTGELGEDVYVLSPSSGWALSLVAADGITPLADTDADGEIDTGPVSQGSTAVIIARMQAPSGAVVGDANVATIIARSSLNPSKSKTATLQAAIPAPFAQVYWNDYDNSMSLYLAQPGGQALKATTSSDWRGYDPAVAEAPNGNFAYFWSRGRCLDDYCNNQTHEIEYTLLDKYGETARSAGKLTDNSGLTNIHDSSPVVAISPNGSIGVLWYRYAYQYSNNTWLNNYNIFFVVLNPSGNIIYGPHNLTNNAIWGSGNNYPQYYDPQITATGDNRFVLAWQRDYSVNPCSTNDCSLNDIYYAVRATSGVEVKGLTQFTYDTTGSNYEAYHDPNLTSLAGNQALITWRRDNDHDIYFAVLDSTGEVIKDKTNLSADGSNFYDHDPDAVQLPDGKIVVGYTGNSIIRFAVLDTSFNRIADPTTLSTPAAITGSGYVSVAADNAGRAILTWMDNVNRNLFYALVNGSGGILTQPMIFRSRQGSSKYIQTSYSGYGNTSYSSIDQGVDTAIQLSSTIAGGAPGSAASVGVKFTNHGLTAATGVKITATLGAGLTYLGDTSGISPTILGDQITWDLPELGFLDPGQFVLYAGVPDSAAVGTLYPVGLEITQNEPDANTADNSASLDVMAALQVYLPLIMR